MGLESIYVGVAVGVSDQDLLGMEKRSAVVEPAGYMRMKVVVVDLTARLTTKGG